MEAISAGNPPDVDKHVIQIVAGGVAGTGAHRGLEVVEHVEVLAPAHQSRRSSHARMRLGLQCPVCDIDATKQECNQGRAAGLMAGTARCSCGSSPRTC